MGWWQRLLSIDAPPDATLEALEPSLRGWWPVLVTVLVALLAAVIGVFFYYLEPKRLGNLRRLLLIGIRGSTLCLLCLLIFRPVQCSAVFKGGRPRNVVLLIDNSMSMAQQDRRVSAADRARVALTRNLLPLGTKLDDPLLSQKLPADLPSAPPRVDLVRAVFNHPGLDLKNRLGKIGPLRAFLFGHAVRRIEEKPGGDNPQTLADQISADEASTALAGAIEEVLLKGDGDLPAAIVVVTDGNDNASKVSLAEVARECKRLGVPLHVYGVGSTEGGLLQIRDMTVPEMVFAEDTVAVPVRYRCQGIKQGTVEITLTANGKEVARREVPATEGDDLVETLIFTPPKEEGANRERRDLIARIRIKDNEVYKDEIKRPIQVVDRKVKVLVIESTPRWEFKFLQRILLRDRRVEARFLVTQGDPRTLASGEPYIPAFPATRKDLFAYDLLILGDVPAIYLGPEKIKWIRDFVSEGGGLVQIAGRVHAPSSYQDTGLAEVLPVEFQFVRQANPGEVRPQAFLPVPTRQGERSEMMALADTKEENQRLWRELPSLYWHYPVTRLRPAAVSLLNHPTEKAGEDPMPLLAMHYFGKGLVLFSGIEETWRWRFNTQDQYFARFWGQVIYAIGLPRSMGSRQSQLGLDRSEVIQGRPGQLFARLLDANFQPLDPKKFPHVEAELEQIDAPPGEKRTTMVRLEAVAGSPGEYRTGLANDQPGRFVLKLKTSEPASLEYRVVLPPNHEQSLRGLNEAGLREAAGLSGGDFYREESLEQLPAKVQPQRAEFTVRQQVVPWNPLAFVIFIGLITLEWVIRKFSNLS